MAPSSMNRRVRAKDRWTGVRYNPATGVLSLTGSMLCGDCDSHCGMTALA